MQAHAYTVDYVDLAIIDLSKVHTVDGRAELAVQARDAMRGQGFLCVVNHGLSRDEVRWIVVHNVLSAS